MSRTSQTMTNDWMRRTERRKYLQHLGCMLREREREREEGGGGERMEQDKNS